jgi:hypothetical protein
MVAEFSLQYAKWGGRAVGRFTVYGRESSHVAMLFHRGAVDPDMCTRAKVSLKVEAHAEPRLRRSDSL